MIDREFVMDLRAEIRKMAREEVKKAIEEQTEPKQDESGSISCVDTVQVVRCKDCNKYQDVHQWCKLHELEMQPMDFCSYGERKDAAD